MASENKDIIRVFDTPANLAANLRSGMFGYDTTNDRLGVKRLADGNMKYFENIGNAGLTIAGDSGTGEIILASETLAVEGGANQIETSISGNTLTVGFVTNPRVSGNLSIDGTLDVDGDASFDSRHILSVTGRVNLGAGASSWANAQAAPDSATSRSRIIVTPDADPEYYALSNLVDGQVLFIYNNESGANTARIGASASSNADIEVAARYMTVAIYDETIGKLLAIPYEPV